MKKTYKKPELEIVEFDTEDVITTSDGTSTDDEHTGTEED